MVVRKPCAVHSSRKEESLVSSLALDGGVFLVSVVGILDEKSRSMHCNSVGSTLFVSSLSVVGGEVAVGEALSTGEATREESVDEEDTTFASILPSSGVVDLIRLFGRSLSRRLTVTAFRRATSPSSMTAEASASLLFGGDIVVMATRVGCLLQSGNGK